MGIAAALGIGGAVAGIGGALISANGAESAAKTQANAANNAAATQLNMFNQTRTSLEPFIGAGSSAISQLANIFGFGNGTNGTGVGSAGGTGFNPTTALSQLTQTPGYQFGLQQGGQALDRSAASRGLLLSGAQLQDSQKFGTDYATQQAYNPYISELNTITGVGENAAAGVGNNSTTAANGIAASQLAAGQATASGQVATGNILGQASTQLLSGLGSSFGGAAPITFAADGTPSDLAGLI
jgi:hypothetical protein